MFIEKIEMQPPYLFLIRPRRFGKSLTLAMLEAYYDVNHAEQFDELFGQLYIGQHPTKLHNQFLNKIFWRRAAWNRWTCKSVFQSSAGRPCCKQGDS